MSEPIVVWILYVTGAITAAAGLQYLAPVSALKLLSKLSLQEAAGLFYARHWGLLAAVIGGLLCYAASHPAVREPVLVAAMLEKLGLVALIFAQWRMPHTQGMRLTCVFDATCSILYAMMLVSLPH